MLSVDKSAIVVFVIVWILVYVLSKTFFRKVSRVMSERNAKIQEDKDSCERALQEYEEMVNRMEESLKSARSISNATRAKFESEALEIKKKLLEEISAEGRNQVAKARKELREKIESLKKELEAEAGEMAERIEEKLLH